ncbi:multidrug effflux MFS transporter [Vibrio parahaemolyticus]|uniref:multidrug effflux MFS transporter n=1 Tax=Vibrio parahaemolyticus TaxID=670 RepID=UPI00111CF7A2|nr:multidrug effflux MFS transporter [Vibrio parahaemolyticus]MCR9648159.1 multidrug effflux MFS transporter [Vibrio parahaemolyticus]MCR9799347.1 multidrug effflux MFS transporter [Vibrio parahaemolyticus]MDF4283960.1 multidrug effflux MFS transporter [Vibrio parahaemolyticus]MDF4315138.1 multidrug effflux MFS transporter [Vibrio parahaemolyticus]MDF4965154.1 multidrug effflux MFS transporter [Vibrio parahaemolyticus]
MKTKPSIGLMVVMLMFPQIVETIYSPALGDIAQSFSTTYSQAAQTLSIYFTAFAIGVVVWGLLADKWGRRPTMLVGLLVYGLSALVAMQTDRFDVVMLARALSAFGIAVGSVVTQTMLRDSFSGEELGKVFGVMGIGISVSPVIGMLLGGQLTALGGYQTVFFTLFVMALGLFVYNVFKLPETQIQKQPLNMGSLLGRMLRDAQIWQSTLLVALYNIALFSYYQLGAFTFEALGFSSSEFGYSGVVLGLGTFVGSLLNKFLLGKGRTQTSLLWIASILLLAGGFGVFWAQTSIWFLVPMLLVVMAFGIAIPNVLSAALVDYKQQAGSAGAVFGLMYYLLIGSGLGLAGIIQNLGVVQTSCAVTVLLVTMSRMKK